MVKNCTAGVVRLILVIAVVLNIAKVVMVLDSISRGPVIEVDSMDK